MKQILKSVGRALGNILGELADKTVDTILNPIEETFGVRKHKETTLFRDAFAPGKEAPAKGQRVPEIDYVAPRKKAEAVNKENEVGILLDACSKESPEVKKEAKEKTKEQGLELGISL